MAIIDDPGIPDETVVLRVLLEGWISETNNRIRPNSLAFLDSNYDNSGFISNSVSLAELQRLFPGQPVAGVPVAVIRRNGFAVECRPNECPEDYRGNRDDHVVVGTPEPCGRKEYQRKSQSIVKDPSVIMLRLIER
jgi:hypothetical protein